MTETSTRVTETTARAGRSPEYAAPYQRRNHLVVYLFLLGLAGAASDIGGRARPAWLAGLALGAFVACFVVLVETAPHWRSIGEHRPTSARVRRLRSLLVIALAALAVATTLAWGSDWLALFIFVVVMVSETVPARFATVSIAVVAAAAAVAGLVARHDASMTAAASWALSTVMAGYIAQLLHRRGVLIGELRATQGEVARLAAADAVTEERLRFARDLHDLLGHSLSVIVLKAELARRLLERQEAPTQVRAEVGDVEEIARRALEEVREAVTGYRARSFTAELDRTRVALEAAGTTVAVEVADEPLPPDVETLLARVLREATTNIVRHSRAHHAHVGLTRSGAGVRLEVRDDGVGGEAASVQAAAARPPDDERGDAAGGTGLRSLAERVAEAGGHLEAGSATEGGVRVVVDVSLGASASAGAASPAVAASGRVRGLP